MGTVWQSVVEKYNYVVDDLSHPLQREWTLTRSPLPLFVILLSYNIFCTKIGPMLMKNRPPYKLETTIKIYNILQILLSSYVAYEGYVYIFSGKFNFKCQGIEDENKRVAPVIHVYLVTKLIDLLDTIFFVLRKSYRQITFLHLYHHTLMPVITWIGLKYFPGGQGTIFGTINSVVHVFMYFYYFLSGLGPQYRKYLWWKKYLTVMQIVQFLIVFLHSFNSLFYSCSFHNTLKVLTMLFSLIFVWMFSKFYYLTYIVKKPQSTPTQQHMKGENNENGEKDNGNVINDRKNGSNGNYANGFDAGCNKNMDGNVTNGKSKSV